MRQHYGCWHQYRSHSLVGCEPGRSYGRLISALRETPDAVVLLDEFERAHGDVHKKFLTAWNDGYVTEASDGRQVSTNRSIFMLTSNAATEPLTAIAQCYRDSPDEMRSASIAALPAAGIAPEVLNRQFYRAVDVPTEGPTGWDWSRVMATPERLARATQIRDWAAA